MSNPGLRPFWRYYGGKWRAASRYPAPRHEMIVEPFAGAAGYALRYPERKVVLVERYHVLAEIWRYLIDVSASEIRSIPCVDSIHDLPAGTAQGAIWLIGFCLQDTAKRPCHNLSAGMRQKRAAGDLSRGWSESHRERVASQVDRIRHWTVIEGDYSDVPNYEATWFIDPPYQRAGAHYQHGSKGIDFATLGAWCRARRGQVIVCEADGADWLPFSPLYKVTTKFNENKTAGGESVWLNDSEAAP